MEGNKHVRRTVTCYYVDMRGVYQQAYDDPTLIGDFQDVFAPEYDEDNKRVWGRPTGSKLFEQLEGRLPRQGLLRATRASHGTRAATSLSRPRQGSLGRARAGLPHARLRRVHRRFGGEWLRPQAVDDQLQARTTG